MYLTQKQIQSKYSAKYSASDKVRPSLGEAPAPYIHLVGIPCSPDCRTTCDASMQIDSMPPKSVTASVTYAKPSVTRH